MSSLSWKTITSKIVYQNPWLKIIEDQVVRPDGKNGLYGYLVKPSGVFVVPRDDNGYIYLLCQYRYPLKKNIFEIPAGVIDQRQSLLANAKRELLEETGIRAKNWKRLGHFYVGPGHETTDTYAYLATGFKPTEIKKITQEGDEAIQKVVKVSEKQLRHLITSQKIKCGISLAALNLYFLQSA